MKGLFYPDLSCNLKLFGGSFEPESPPWQLAQPWDRKSTVGTTILSQRDCLRQGQMLRNLLQSRRRVNHPPA